MAPPRALAAALAAAAVAELCTLTLSAVQPPVSDHPALGALGMGGDLTGRAHTRASNHARTRSAGAPPPSDQCDPHAVDMAAIPADASKPVQVNATVFAQFAWSPVAAAESPPLPTDWIGLYCAQTAAALQSMGSLSLARWNLLNTTYKNAGGGLVGRVPFAIPAINAWAWGGTCEFRYFTHRDGSSYCLSSTQPVPFVVAGVPNEGAAMPVSLTTDRASASVGDILHMKYAWGAGGAAAGNDWVGVYCASDAVALLDVANDAICETGCEALWQYVHDDPDWAPQSGSIPIKVPPTRYPVCELRYFNRVGSSAYNQQGKSKTTFNVTNAGLQWGAVELSLAPGGPIDLGAGFEVAWSFKGVQPQPQRGRGTAAHRSKGGAAASPSGSDVIAFYCGDATSPGAADTEPLGGFGLSATPDHKYLDYALASTLELFVL